MISFSLNHQLYARNSRHQKNFNLANQLFYDLIFESEGTIYKQARNIQTLRVPLSYDNQIIIFAQQLLIMFIKLETRFILILLWYDDHDEFDRFIT